MPHQEPLFHGPTMNRSIGLAANGNGDIASFTGLNTTSNPVVAIITVTPTANGCVGPDSTFTITVNPTPLVNIIADQALCANFCN